MQHVEDRFDLNLSSEKPFDVIGVGVNAVDQLCIVPRYPRLDTKTRILDFKKLPGGPTATALVFLARMGLAGKYIGKVGSDEFGTMIQESLKAEHVDVSSIVVEQGVPNQSAFIVIDQRNGERTIFWHRDPQLDLADAELDPIQVCAGKVLHLDGVDGRAALSAAAWAQDAGIPVVMDIDTVVPEAEKLFQKVDFLITSAEFPAEFTGLDDPSESLLALGELCGGFLASTNGVDGAMAVIGNECVRFPAFRVDAVDTTGAGDVFHGAFIYGIFQNWSVGRIMRFSNAAAGLNCEAIGAMEGIPSLSEILNLAGAD